LNIPLNAVSALEILEEVGVETIADDYFSSCFNLQNLKIANTIRTIGQKAFRGCPILSLVIPDSVKAIGDEAFADCRQITSIDLPDALTTLGENIFSGCTAIVTLKVGGSVNGTPTLAPSITTSTPITASGRNSVILSGSDTVSSLGLFQGMLVSGNNVPPNTLISEIRSNTAYSLSNKLGLPVTGNISHSPRSILDSLGLKETTTTAPASLTAKSAIVQLSGNDTVSSLNLAAGLIVRGSSLPEGTRIVALLSLTSFSISNPSNSTTTSHLSHSYGIENAVVTAGGKSASLDANAFKNAINLKKVTLNDSIREIGTSAFEGCVNMTQVDFSKSLVKIGSNAFKSCGSLKTINLPNSLSVVGDDAFSGCGNVNQLTIPGKIGMPIGIPKDVKVSVNITPGTSYIREGAFEAFTGINRISIPEGIVTINASAFANCRVAEPIRLPSSLQKIEALAFYGCNSIVNADLSSVKSIGEGAFWDCAKLAQVTLGENLKALNPKTFRGCLSLNSIKLPKGLESIGNEALFQCENLVSASLNADLKSIGEFAFYGCKSLSKLTLPTELTKVGKSAFSGCSAIQTLSINQKLTSLDDFAFYRCSSLNAVELPPSVTNIGTQAFGMCSKMKSLSILNRSAIVENAAFLGCPIATLKVSGEVGLPLGAPAAILRNLTLLEDSTSIRPAAFKGCVNLSRLIIPSRVTAIGANAFKDCASLESLTLPATLNSIGDDAFLGCLALTSVTFLGNAPYVSKNASLPFPLNQTLTLRIPNASSGYDGYPWTSYELNSYQVAALPESLAFAQVERPTPERNYPLTVAESPRFQGILLDPSDSTTHGKIQITSSQTGSVTGKVDFHNQSFAFTGRLTTDPKSKLKSLSTVSRVGGQQFIVELNINTRTQKVSGQVKSQNVSWAVEAEPMPSWSSASHFDADLRSPTAHLSIATVSINRSADALTAARTADGEILSAASGITSSGRIPWFTRSKSRKSSFGGWLNLSNQEAKVSGTLQTFDFTEASAASASSR
jgi:hypothetical protein